MFFSGRKNKNGISARLRGTRECCVCSNVIANGVHCKSCDFDTCTDCAEGGRSSTLGKVGRAVAGIYTLGTSEIARKMYRNHKISCGNCSSREVVRF